MRLVYRPTLRKLTIFAICSSLQHLAQFAALLNVILDKQKANLDHSDGKCMRMNLFIVENELHSAFPNIEIALRIHLCLMFSNCTGEQNHRQKAFNREALRLFRGA